MFRPRRISSTDARKHFTKIVNSVQFSSRSYVVENYRNPVVRIINEHYIKVLEEVLGKKTVNQVMQITGNDRLLEAEKMEQIKKVFQRRLSGSPRPERRPLRPQPKQVTERGSDEKEPRSKDPQKHKHPASSINPQASNNRVLLLSNGKNYQ